MGLTAWLAATHRPDGVTALSALSSAGDFGRNWIYRDGGPLNLNFVIGWCMVVSIDTCQRLGTKDSAIAELGLLRKQYERLDGVDPEGARRVYCRVVEIVREVIDSGAFDCASRFREMAPWLSDWLEHPEPDDPYWSQIRLPNHYSAINVPVLQVTGWYDQFLGGVLQNHYGLARSGKHDHRLVIGPWFHQTFAPTTTISGDRDFGVDAGIDLDDLQLRWFDHWVRGFDTGMTSEPPVRIFVMGENVWRSEDEWPLARTVYTRYYLHSGGNANSAAGDGVLSTELPLEEPFDDFVHDPNQPVPTYGGAVALFGLERGAGAFDQQGIEARDDVLIYTTAAMPEDIEVTGPVVATLWASTSAADADFTVRLVDVDPSGEAFNLCEGVARVSRKVGKGGVVSGAIYCFEIDAWATSNVFRRGHRIRLEVASSNYPHFEVNAGADVGAMPGSQREAVVAQQTVFHDAVHPSHVLLPVISRQWEPAGTAAE